MPENLSLFSIYNAKRWSAGPRYGPGTDGASRIKDNYKNDVLVLQKLY